VILPSTILVIVAGLPYTSLTDTLFIEPIKFCEKSSTSELPTDLVVIIDE